MAVFAEDQSEAVIRRQPHGPQSGAVRPQRADGDLRRPGQLLHHALDLLHHERVLADTAAQHDQPGIEHADTGSDEAADILRMAVDPGEGRRRAVLGPGEELLGGGGWRTFGLRPIPGAALDERRRSQVMLQPLAAGRLRRRPGEGKPADLAGRPVRAAQQLAADHDAEADAHADLEIGEGRAVLGGAVMHLAEGGAIDVVLQDDRRCEPAPQLAQDGLGPLALAAPQPMRRHDARDGDRDAAKNLIFFADRQHRRPSDGIDRLPDLIDRRLAPLGNAFLDRRQGTVVQGMRHGADLRLAHVDADDISRRRPQAVDLGGPARRHPCGSRKR